MDYSVYSSLMTVVMLTVFVGIVAWAWSSKRESDFSEAARVPLNEEPEPVDATTRRGSGEQS